MLHSIVEALLSWLEQMGYWGIMLGLMLEIIPSEIVLSYGGYLVSKGNISFIGAVIFGTIGGTIAQIFVYWIGRYGGRPFLEKYGKYLLINKHHIDVAEDWFNRYGTGVIFTARFIPVVRHAISVPAGIARMPLGRFTFLTTLAVIPWSILFIWLGFTLGEQWESIDEVAGQYVKPAMIAAVVLLLLYVGWKWMSIRRKRVSREFHAAASPRAELSGERDVTQELAALGKEYVLFSGVNLRVRGGVHDMDYLAVGPNGLFHIGIHQQSGEVSFPNPAATFGDAHSKDPADRLYRHEYALKEILRGEGIEADAIGILAFIHPNVQLQGKHSAFAAVKAAQLADYIKSYRSRRPLDSKTVQQIASIIRKHTE